MDRLRATVRGVQPYVPNADELVKASGEHINDKAFYEKVMLVQAYNGQAIEGWNLVNRLHIEAFEMGYRFASDKNKSPFVADNSHELTDFAEITGKGLGPDFRFDGKRRISVLYALGILEGAKVALRH